MGKWLNGAKKVRNSMDLAGTMIPDEQAASMAALFMPWNAEGTYEAGDRIRYQGTLYKCLLSHTAQPDWMPGTAPSLWVRVDDPAIEWPDWVQPQGAHDAYILGAKVTHNEKHWISTVNANTWEPGVYGWEETE